MRSLLLKGRRAALQFGGDFDVFPVERGQPVAVLHRTSEFFFLSERHVVVGGTDDGRGGQRGGRRPFRTRVLRRIERRVRPAECAGAVHHRPVPAHARRPRRGRRFRTHRAVSVCEKSVRRVIRRVQMRPFQSRRPATAQGASRGGLPVGRVGTTHSNQKNPNN